MGAITRTLKIDYKNKLLKFGQLICPCTIFWRRKILRRTVRKGMGSSGEEEKEDEVLEKKTPAWDVRGNFCQHKHHREAKGCWLLWGIDTLPLSLRFLHSLRRQVPPPSFFQGSKSSPGYLFKAKCLWKRFGRFYLFEFTSWRKCLKSSPAAFHCRLLFVKLHKMPLPSASCSSRLHFILTLFKISLHFHARVFFREITLSGFWVLIYVRQPLWLPRTVCWMVWANKESKYCRVFVTSVEDVFWYSI